MPKFTFKGSGGTTQTKRRGRPKGSKNKPKVAPAVKRYVKRAIAVDQENKYVWINLENQVVLTAPTVGPLPTFFDLQPVITQGIGKSNRIGTRCRIRKATLNFRLWLDPNVALTSNIDQPMFVYYAICRPRSEQNVFTQTENDQMFYTGPNTVSGFDSTDYRAPWYVPNKDSTEFKYWTRRGIKLGWADYPDLGTAIRGNNDFRSSYEFNHDMTKVYNKLLHFNNAGVFAEGNNWYLIFYVQKMNLNTSPTNWEKPQITGRVFIEYEDA